VGFTITKSSHVQMKNKARKCVREYEVKLEELKNECHEAWISLQDSNRINEMLRDDLCAKSLCCDSLGRSKLYFGSSSK
jgi:kinesin family protein C2/C3